MATRPPPRKTLSQTSNAGTGGLPPGLAAVATAGKLRTCVVRNKSALKACVPAAFARSMSGPDQDDPVGNKESTNRVPMNELFSIALTPLPCGARRASLVCLRSVMQFLFQHRRGRYRSGLGPTSQPGISRVIRLGVGLWRSFVVAPPPTSEAPLRGAMRRQCYFLVRPAPTCWQLFLSAEVGVGRGQQARVLTHGSAERPMLHKVAAKGAQTTAQLEAHTRRINECSSAKLTDQLHHDTTSAQPASSSRAVGRLSVVVPGELAPR